MLRLSIVSVCVFSLSCSSGGGDDGGTGGIDLSSLTAQELNDNLDIPDSSAIAGDLPAGADTGIEPQVTSVTLPDPIEFGVLFQVEVDFQTGSDALTKLFVQVDGGEGYFELATSAVPNTAGFVSFPCVINAPSQALTKAFSLIVQLEGESGTSGLPTIVDLNMSDESSGTGGTGGGSGGGDHSCSAINPDAPVGTTDVSGMDDGRPWTAVGVAAHVKTASGEGGPTHLLMINFYTQTTAACGLQEAAQIVDGEELYTARLVEVSSAVDPPGLPLPGIYLFNNDEISPLDAPFMSGAGMTIGAAGTVAGTCVWSAGGFAVTSPTGQIELTTVTPTEVVGSFTYDDGDGKTASGSFTAPVCDDPLVDGDVTEACCFEDAS